MRELVSLNFQSTLSKWYCKGGIGLYKDGKPIVFKPLSLDLAFKCKK